MDPLSAWWRVRSPWPDLPGFYTGGVRADHVDKAGINDLVGGLISSVRGQSYLAWHDYQIAAELHARLVGTSERADDLLLKDGFADCAARISLSLCVGQGEAEKLLHRALALRDRLPQVADRLKIGRITAEREDTGAWVAGRRPRSTRS